MTSTQKAATIWKAAHGELKLQMTRATFDTWLRDAHLVAEENGTLVIGVPNVYARDWLEHRLKGMVARTVKQVAGREVDVRFIMHSEHSHAEDDLRSAGPLLANLKPKPSSNGSHPDDSLNARYTFDTFAEEPGNRLARAVAVSAAESPGKGVNPLYICGDVGLGKSHLLHAIGHHASSRGFKVLCVPAETFTNDLVEAIRNQTTASMREKYRSVDVLLIDDIQFMAGKETTQEEFFHTFNALYDQGKQIVVTGSKPPRKLDELDRRIRSRLEGGMVADLKAPSLEGRIEILRVKAYAQNVNLPDGILERIAQRVDGSVRELEGALNRVLVRAEVSHTDLTLALVDAALSDFAPRGSDLTLDQILAAAASVYRVDPEDIRGRSRARMVSLARQVVMYLAREEADISLPEIGEGLGGRNHSTVLYSCNRIEDQLVTDRLLRSQVTLIKKDLEAVQTQTRLGQ